MAAGFLFLSLASYSRVETFTGIITPNTGVSNIGPTRAGVIVSLAVRDGQNVPAGAELATIGAGENLRAIVESGDYRRPEFAIRYAVTYTSASARRSASC